MRSVTMGLRWGLALGGLGLLGGCNNDKDAAPAPPAPAPAATYTVGGAVSGLNGSVTLTNNGGDSRALSANGAFTFATALAGGGVYSVAVSAQPANQTCAVTSGAGNIAAASISSVTVTCATNTHSVGGTVSGLAGAGLVLQNNGADNLAVAADGAFTFTTRVMSGGAYEVSVQTQPSSPAQTCTPASNTGTAAAAVTNVTVTCVNNPIGLGSADIGPAGGTVNGEYGAQIIIPPGALASTVTIGLHRDSSNSPAFVVTDVAAVGATYELTPHGQAFTLPVTVRIPFDATQVYNDADPLLYKAETGGTFAPLATNVNGGFLEAAVSSFSWVLPSSAATKPRMVYTIENNAGALQLVSLRINRTTGVLSASTSQAPTGDFPTSVVAHPSGKFLYVTNAGSTTMNSIAPNSVALYPLNTVNGNIVKASTASVTTRQPPGYRATMPVIHPNGKFLYVINFGAVYSEAGGDIDEFAINGATGALTLTGAAISGNGSQPMGIAFDRLGAHAYVLYGGSTSTNPLSSQIARYDVSLTTGEFTGPVATTPVCGLGLYPWSIAIDPNGRALHVACNTGNEIASFSITGTGDLSSLGTNIVRDRPASLAMDIFGRFLFAAKQTPFYSVNALGYRMDANSGALTLANQVLSGCLLGACGGPVAIIAEPQGNFVYSIDAGGSLGSLTVDAATGALAPSGARGNISVPSPGGIGFPFTFAASGVSPVWQSNCTQGCTMSGPVISSGGGGGGNPPSNPSPPSSHYLTVTVGAWFGSVTSSPFGIDYGPPTLPNPTGDNDSSAEFAAGTPVQLCSLPPGQPAGVYDITWMGSCSGTSRCTTVIMDSDKSCHANFQPHLP
jgi:6-phosphogluconolactonase (cycloisomerase 2 family)